MKPVTKLLFRMLIAFTLLLIVLMGLIGILGLTSKYEPVEFAVVLGNKVELNGKPSPRLAARLDKSVELYEQGFCKQIIVSGGEGVEGYDEAVIMAEYLYRNGVPNSAVIKDSDGYNSHKTSVNAKALSGDSSIIAVSQYFHLPRCKLSLRNAGFTRTYGTYPHYFEPRDIYSLFREIPGILKYKIKKL